MERCSDSWYNRSQVVFQDHSGTASTRWIHTISLPSVYRQWLVFKFILLSLFPWKELCVLPHASGTNQSRIDMQEYACMLHCLLQIPNPVQSSTFERIRRRIFPQNTLRVPDRHRFQQNEKGKNREASTHGSPSSLCLEMETCFWRQFVGVCLACVRLLLNRETTCDSIKKDPFCNNMASSLLHTAFFLLRRMSDHFYVFCFYYDLDVFSVSMIVSKRVLSFCFLVPGTGTIVGAIFSLHFLSKWLVYD